LSIRRIRSVAHRRILLWLSQGPSTVSEIAQQFSMRMPHASLACRQLRAKGDVYRDDAGGIRNALLYLTQAGIERIEEDGLAKVKHHIDTIPVGKDGIVLQSDDQHVLVGYLQPPKSPLNFIPDAANSLSESSNGNEGGAWVLFQIQNLRWYDLATLVPTEAPQYAASGTLDDFSAGPTKIGIVRGAVVERKDASSVLEGQWFSSLQSTSPPSSLLQGKTILGTVEGTDYGYAPPHGAHADLPSSLDRTLVFNVMGQGCLILNEQNSDAQRELPLEVLRSWLRLRHPRMSTIKLNARYEEMRSQLDSGMNRMPLPLRRDLIADFGTVHWRELHFDDGPVDLYGVSPLGLQALCEHVLSHARIPFVMEWPFPNPDQSLLERVLTHPMCKMLVTRHLDGLMLPSATVHIKDSPVLAQLRVHLNRSTVLPLDLDSKAATSQQHRFLEFYPLHAEELLAACATIELDPLHFTRVVSDPREATAMMKALDVYPTGNETMANELETKWPIAAWIASPPGGRESRWIRLQDRLPRGWVNLLPPQHVDLLTLAHSLHKGIGTWREKAFRRLTLELRSSPEILLSLSTSMDHEEKGSWLAAVVLGASSSLGGEYNELMKKGSLEWLDHPHLPHLVLPMVFPSTRVIDAERHLLLDQWLKAAQVHPETSFISLWAKAIQTTQRNEPWVSEDTRSLMQHLPQLWWAPYASQWLISQLNTSSGRSWLKEQSISWPALLTHPKGQRGGFPGTHHQHPGYNLSTEDLMGIKLLQSGPGTPSLNDLFEMTYALEQGLPVPTLQTHPEAAWLVQPIESWPNFTPETIEDGDSSIGLLLYSRSFAARQQMTMD